MCVTGFVAPGASANRRMGLHPVAIMVTEPPPAPGQLVRRHALATRVWHWLNVVAVTVMLMSGLMIFNAHPRLYWGKAGHNYDRAWLTITGDGTKGRLTIGPVTIPTTGVLGRWTDGAGVPQRRAFPSWATIPSWYDLALARRWHIAFAWALVLPGLAYWLWAFLFGHARRDLLPTRAQLRPGHIWADVRNHARLRFPTGLDATTYNVLQKLSYVGIIFVVLPLLVLTGLTMSPAMDAAWPWLPQLFGGRQSARSIHFLMTTALVAFVVVHLVMVLLSGPVNGIRSMVTGRFRLPKARP
jgi:thiosulfate reductase cytochrome b subunit